MGLMLQGAPSYITHLPVRRYNTPMYIPWETFQNPRKASSVETTQGKNILFITNDPKANVLYYELKHVAGLNITDKSDILKKYFS